MRRKSSILQNRDFAVRQRSCCLRTNARATDPLQQILSLLRIAPSIDQHIGKCVQQTSLSGCEKLAGGVAIQDRSFAFRFRNKRTVDMRQGARLTDGGLQTSKTGDFLHATGPVALNDKERRVYLHRSRHHGQLFVDCPAIRQCRRSLTSATVTISPLFERRSASTRLTPKSFSIRSSITDAKLTNPIESQAAPGPIKTRAPGLAATASGESVSSLATLIASRRICSTLSLAFG